MLPEWEIWLDTNLPPAIAKWMADFTVYTVKSAYVLSYYKESDLSIYKKAMEVVECRRIFWIKTTIGMGYRIIGLKTSTRHPHPLGKAVIKPLKRKKSFRKLTFTRENYFK